MVHLDSMDPERTRPDPTLVERVRKLLDKAARTDNTHESESFARKAAELIARHRIEPERLTRAERPADLALSEVTVGRGAYVRGRLALLGGIAEAHDVRMIYRSTPSGSVATLAGRRDDLSMVELVYHSLHRQAADQMSAIRRSTGASTQRHRRAFLFGFADRIGEILSAARADVESSASTAPSGPDVAATALVLRQRRERVDEFARTSWGRVRSAPRPSAVVADGYSRGGRAAERADVGRSRIRAVKSLDRGLRDRGSQ